MDLVTLRSFLAWCAVLNLAFLFVWWMALTLARDGIRKLHGQFFRLEEERFDEIHYRAMVYYKMGTILLYLTPYLVLRFMV